MERRLLIELFKNGMEYPHGKRRVWIRRLFEITVLTKHRVEVDEYEGFFEETVEFELPKEAMFHVGKTILQLKEGKVTHQEGSGWVRDET